MGETTQRASTSDRRAGQVHDVLVDSRAEEVGWQREIAKTTRQNTRDRSAGLLGTKVGL
jgi:hypothetical protein